MRRKTWDKVTMTWDWEISGLGTSVHNDGHFDPTLHDPKIYGSGDGKIHKLYGVTIVSLPHEENGEGWGERWARAELGIKRTGRTCGETGPNTDAIVSCLVEALAKLSEGVSPICAYAPRVFPPKTKSWTDSVFTVDFALRNGEQFCDSAIEVTRAIFTGLGVHDERGWRLADFSLERETSVLLDGSWITFPNWLRISHRLPIKD